MNRISIQRSLHRNLMPRMTVRLILRLQNINFLVRLIIQSVFRPMRFHALRSTLRLRRARIPSPAHIIRNHAGPRPTLRPAILPRHRQPHRKHHRKPCQNRTLYHDRIPPDSQIRFRRPTIPPEIMCHQSKHLSMNRPANHRPSFACLFLVTSHSSLATAFIIKREMPSRGNNARASRFLTFDFQLLTVNSQTPFH